MAVAQRDTKFFLNTDYTDLTETHGFFNCVVFNNFVEYLRITTDFWPLRGHRRFSAIIGVTGVMPMISAMKPFNILTFNTLCPL
jgi:hypothetical protein